MNLNNYKQAYKKITVPQELIEETAVKMTEASRHSRRDNSLAKLPLLSRLAVFFKSAK